jgi:hypothetical protein
MHPSERDAACQHVEEVGFELSANDLQRTKLALLWLPVSWLYAAALLPFTFRHGAAGEGKD